MRLKSSDSMYTGVFAKIKSTQAFRSSRQETRANVYLDRIYRMDRIRANPAYPVNPVKRSNRGTMTIARVIDLLSRIGDESDVDRKLEEMEQSHWRLSDSLYNKNSQHRRFHGFVYYRCF